MHQQLTQSLVLEQLIRELMSFIHCAVESIAISSLKWKRVCTDGSYNYVSCSVREEFAP